jgi:hypothetical protein
VLRGEAAVAERLASSGLRFNRSGENVGYNTNFESLHSEWMNSPPHRENILNPDYTVAGIGVVKAEDGVWWATTDFAHSIVQRTAAQAEDAAAQSFEELRKKLSRMPMERINNAGVRDLACEMAKSGKLSAAAAARLPDVRQSVVYNNSRAEVLPKSAQSLARTSTLSKYAVGACFTADQPNNPGGTFYVVIVFY